MDIEPIAYLLSEGGPILRWLTTTQLSPQDGLKDRQVLQDKLLACREVRHWLALLAAGPIHHSKDSSTENVLAKLGEFGLQAGMLELDRKALPYCAISEGSQFLDEALIIVPFLVRLGYAREQHVAEWMTRRIEILYDLACRADYSLYMDESERLHLPRSQRTQHGRPKLFYKTSFNQHWGVLGLPTCYDLFALAYLPKSDPLTRQKVEKIVSYLLAPGFQDTPGGYIWNPQLHRAYAAGRVFLACLPGMNEIEKLVLFMEILSHFETGRSSDWFQQGMLHLESFRTARSTYSFPPRYISEKHNYYLYAGMHMGLGEWPRNARALELESTFRMLRLKSQLS